MKKQRKTIDVKKDALMSNLCFNASNALHLICEYMQQSTPYGEVYEKAYKKYKIVQGHFEGLREALAECVDLAYAKKEEK